MKRIKNNKGFTLVEMLAVILVLTIAVALSAEGIPMIQKAYEKQLDESNAGLLLSTTMTVLRTELTTASKIELGDNKITYVNGKNGASSEIECGEEGITITEYRGSGGIERMLVSKEASTDGMYARFNGISLDESVLTIKNLAVYKNGVELAKTDEYKIRITGA